MQEILSFTFKVLFIFSLCIFKGDIVSRQGADILQQKKGGTNPSDLKLKMFCLGAFLWSIYDVTIINFKQKKTWHEHSIKTNLNNLENTNSVHQERGIGLFNYD